MARSKPLIFISLEWLNIALHLLFFICVDISLASSKDFLNLDSQLVSDLDRKAHTNLSSPKTSRPTNAEEAGGPHEDATSSKDILNQQSALEILTSTNRPRPQDCADFAVLKEHQCPHVRTLRVHTSDNQHEGPSLTKSPYNFYIAHTNETTIVFKCQKNHKYASGDLIWKCSSDGNWKGVKPLCKPVWYRSRIFLPFMITVVAFLSAIIFFGSDFETYHERRQRSRQIVNKPPSYVSVGGRQSCYRMKGFNVNVETSFFSSMFDKTSEEDIRFEERSWRPRFNLMLNQYQKNVFKGARALFVSSPDEDHSETLARASRAVDD